MMAMPQQIADQWLAQKLIYLKGYLDALGFLNSYGPIGFQCELLAFDLPAGDPEIIQPLQRCLDYHAHRLFNVYPGQADFSVLSLLDWQAKLCAVLQTGLGLPGAAKNQQLVDKVKFSNHYFCQLLQNEVLTPETKVYELQVDLRGRFYRVLGIDLLFEREDNKLLLLQVLGSD